jgi:predicted nucleic acid-binding protein
MLPRCGTTTVASAEHTYADPSALLKLYLRERESQAVARWRSRAGNPLPLTHHGRVELINGLGLAAHRRLISGTAHRHALDFLAEDITVGRYRMADVPWRAVFERAAQISAEHAGSMGCRTLDVIHIASALELDLRQFLTFDQRQAQLAHALGLKLVRVE